MACLLRACVCHLLWRQFFIALICISSSITFLYDLYATEKNKKRDVRNWFSNDSSDKHHDEERIPIEVEQRGDIPIMHGDCEGMYMCILTSLN